jgi:hypothetical protein
VCCALGGNQDGEIVLHALEDSKRFYATRMSLVRDGRSSYGFAFVMGCSC